MCTDREQLSPREISGYVTCVYVNQWWVAYTLETHDDTEEVTLSFLHPHGPSQYPSRPDIFTVSGSDVLTRVNPTTATGRVYKLSQEDSRNANEVLGLNFLKLHKCLPHLSTQIGKNFTTTTNVHTCMDGMIP